MPTQAVSSQFLQENAVGDGVKSFTKVQVNNMHSLSFIHQVGQMTQFQNDTFFTTKNNVL